MLVRVLANVVALNLCCDVQVESHSTFLVVQVLWLASRNARALFGALVGGSVRARRKFVEAPTPDCGNTVTCGLH